MIKLILILLLTTFCGSTFAQYLNGNNQLKFSSGMQIKEDGEILYNKKGWDKRKHRKDNSIVIMNDRRIESNTWEEGAINIKRHKNKIEVKYKDLKAEKLEVESVFQGIRDEKMEIASLTNFKDEKVSDFTTCLGTKCLSLTKNFCDELAANIGSTGKGDAIEKAKQCLSLYKAMSSFKRSPLIISDLEGIHKKNLAAIDGKLQTYFNENPNFSASSEFELKRMVELGDKNQDYFELLINVLGSCQKNFP